MWDPIVESVWKVEGRLPDRHGADVAARVLRSPYQYLFGNGWLGRPRADEHPTGVPSGDKKLTEAARRRATRVLKALHSSEFDRIMKIEVQYLLDNRQGGEGGNSTEAECGGSS